MSSSPSDAGTTEITDADVGTRSVVVLLAAFIVLDLLTFYGIWTFWPAEEAVGKAAGKTVHVFGYHRSVSRETLFFVIVALSGALGGSIHSLRSISWYIGNRKLKWSWIPFYLLRPLVGATLATLFYFVLRAGLFSPSAQTQATSPYGFAALSALVGLFAEQAVEKLKTVAEQFFQEAPKGADQAPQADTASDQATAQGEAGAPASGNAAVTGDATAISAGEATIAGTATSGALPAAFHFEYGTDTGYGLVTDEQVLAANTAAAPISATLTGLTPATLYHYRVVVTDESGSSYGDDATLMTTA
jgi:hypothetical protein